MHTDIFKRWIDLLMSELEQDEQVLAKGRAYEGRREDFNPSKAVTGQGCSVVVTERRALWISSGAKRWLRSLPFDKVKTYREITQSHRYALALDHESIERRLWVPEHRFLVWAWGNAEDVLPVTRSVLAFSRRDTAAARALRTQLQERGVPVAAPRTLPTHERRRGALYRSSRWSQPVTRK
jgi:hypothetical protein